MAKRGDRCQFRIVGSLNHPMGPSPECLMSILKHRLRSVGAEKLDSDFQKGGRKQRYRYTSPYWKYEIRFNLLKHRYAEYMHSTETKPDCNPRKDQRRVPNWQAGHSSIITTLVWNACQSFISIIAVPNHCDRRPKARW